MIEEIIPIYNKKYDNIFGCDLGYYNPIYVVINMERIKDYACDKDKECELPCDRHGVQNSPTWFSGWVPGGETTVIKNKDNPTLGSRVTKCKYQLHTYPDLFDNRSMTDILGSI